MARKYIIRLYLKYFFSILFALVLFFVGLDFLQVFKKLPPSANLQVLYIVFKTMNGIDLLFPISLVFAMIGMKIALIRSNELVAFYALGYSKRDVIFPLFITATILTTIYIFLHLTSFTYAGEYADNIKKYNSLINATKNLFFKYENAYVYFEKLIPLEQKAENVRIFETKDNDLRKIVYAKEAWFAKEYWHLPNATIIQKRFDHIIVKHRNIDTLQGYKPKILDSVYEGKTNISLLDALYALKLFERQQIDTKRIKALIFYHLFYPFFAPFLMIIIFYFVPVSSRLANLNLFSFSAIVITLLLWGILFTLVKLSFSGVLYAEVAIAVPIVLLGVIAFWLYKKF